MIRFPRKWAKYSCAPDWQKSRAVITTVLSRLLGASRERKIELRALFRPLTGSDVRLVSIDHTSAARELANVGSSWLLVAGAVPAAAQWRAKSSCIAYGNDTRRKVAHWCKVRPDVMRPGGSTGRTLNGMNCAPNLSVAAPISALNARY